MSSHVLEPKTYKHYIDAFNADDEELYSNAYPNHAAWDFLAPNMPLIDCPDADIERIYYFRWWTYRKHLRKTNDGWVVTEFLPDVGWASKHNTISCAAAHHFYEGRWLRDNRFLDDYAMFWFRRGGEPRNYSFWAADSLFNRYLVTGDATVMLELKDDLVANYRSWEKGGETPGKPWFCSWPRRDGRDLFWQVDTGDGMEFSIGGHGYRPSINSYMYGDARAMAAIAAMKGDTATATAFAADAIHIKTLVQQKLWDPAAQFFKTVVNAAGAKPHYDWQRFAPHIYREGECVDVREQIGFIPWYFNLPDPGYEAAWNPFLDPQGFRAPFGPTTAEQRHRNFRYPHTHDCLWNGPCWPFATSQTLTAMANLLANYRQNVITIDDYATALQTYARSHRLVRTDGNVVPWIDENQDPYTGEWIARRCLRERGDDPSCPQRGKDYNHSTFCDLVLSGLAGIRPGADGRLRIHPLIPASWDYFCADRVPCHGQDITVLWDRTGQRYGQGAGLTVQIDGKAAAHAETVCELTASLSGKPGSTEN